MFCTPRVPLASSGARLLQGGTGWGAYFPPLLVCFQARKTDFLPTLSLQFCGALGSARFGGRRRLGKLAPGQSMCHGLLACFLAPGDVSVGFTCRVKVESASAPYGSATYASSSSSAAAVAAAASVGGTPGPGTFSLVSLFFGTKDGHVSSLRYVQPMKTYFQGG